LSDPLRDMIKRHEGLKLRAYLCSAGKITIGYGRNLDDRGISEAEANAMLDNDIMWAREEAKSVFPWFWQLGPARQAALISMIFNMGTPRLKCFSKMISALQKADYLVAANEMLISRWAAQVGKRAVELAEIMKTGQF